ncbi:hypothetical protein Bca4012_082852 [Brassica carinata]|uniref:Uncharacterized protein n=1 Tax=Brassica carinata TaxID=52824 RepID=A0A8X7VB81_BRACI|nr:hypothetical protein Bca52824_027853 [Brassica carinata]
MPNNEKDISDLHPEINTSFGNECRETQSISRNPNLTRNDGQSPVAISSVFNRLFGGLDNTKIKTKNASNKGQSTSTPEIPSNKRKCVLGVYLDYNLLRLQNREVV